jgi:hypothetical protein
LISLVLGDADGNVRLDWLKDWLVDERLPTELGWSPSNPSHGIVDIVKFTDIYKGMAEKLNEQDQFPIGF